MATFVGLGMIISSICLARIYQIQKDQVFGTRQERKGMEVEWISRVTGTCTEMTIAILGDPEKRGCVVTRIFFCHFEAVVPIYPTFLLRSGRFEVLRVRDLRGSFTPCFLPRLGMIGLSCNF